MSSPPNKTAINKTEKKKHKSNKGEDSPAKVDSKPVDQTPAPQVHLLPLADKVLFPISIVIELSCDANLHVTEIKVVADNSVEFKWHVEIFQSITGLGGLTIIKNPSEGYSASIPGEIQGKPFTLSKARTISAAIEKLNLHSYNFIQCTTESARSFLIFVRQVSQ